MGTSPPINSSSFLVERWIAHVGKANPRGNPQAPRRGSQQRGFRDAEPSFGAQAIARPEVAPRFF